MLWLLDSNPSKFDLGHKFDPTKTWKICVGFQTGGENSRQVELFHLILCNWINKYFWRHHLELYLTKWKCQRQPQWIERRAKSVWKTRPWAVRNLSLLKQTKWCFYSVELFSLQLIKLPPNDAFFKHTTGSHYGGQIRRLQNVLVLVYKCVNGLILTYLSSNFVERNSGYDLSCKRITRSSEIEDVYACSKFLYLFRDESLEFTS